MKKRVVVSFLVVALVISFAPILNSQAMEMLENPDLSFEESDKKVEELEESKSVEEQGDISALDENKLEEEPNSEIQSEEEQYEILEEEIPEVKVEEIPEAESETLETEEVVEPIDTIVGRQIFNLNQNWSFNSNDSNTKGWDFPNGSSMGNINLPHCWEYVHPTMSHIPQMNQKTVTYKKIVDISEIKNKNIFLKFYGSARNTEVWIEGEKVGTHVGGYSGFTFDISDYVKGKEKIEIKVNVTNMDVVSIPINVDYTQWAGIYRDVELIATDEQYISIEDYGNKGIYIDTEVNGTTAVVTTRTEISNKAIEDKSMKIVTRIKSQDGTNVAETKRDVTVVAQKKVQTFVSKQNIKNVHLWNGTKDPYLYTLEVLLYDENGQLLDEISEKFGVRTLEIKDGSFYLNGSKYEVHGVGLHQDREGYGNAVPKELKSQDLALMQEMGVNAIRTAHYPHDQYIYELADEKGFLIYNEIPYYLLLSKAESYQQSIKEQLKEMIRQGYNHPSIMMWGIQNEVHHSDSFAAFGDDFKVDVDTLVAFNSQLAELAQKEDQTRYIVQAQIDTQRAQKIGAQWSKNGKVDFTGVNLYVGFKSNVSSGDDVGREEIKNTLSQKIDMYKEFYDAESFMITEYGAGANINQHATINTDFSWDKSDESKEYHYEEWQSFVMETNYNFIQSRDDIPISFVWNMFDFSCYRNEGGIARRNTKGLVCYDHATKKDAYYFYKANWNSEDKFVYLTSKRYIERDSKNQQIKVYSNCENVELFVNGISIGEGRKQQSGVFVWDDVRLEDINILKAVGVADGKTYADEVSGIRANDSKSGVKYQTHIQSNGWGTYVKDGETAGTIGEKLRMEALRVKLTNKEYSGSIEYRAHVQKKGWLDWVKDGDLCGTSGESLRLEALQVRLTKEMAEHYDVYYRAHVQNFGWLDWAKNGEFAGSTGYSYRIEALEIKLVEKGGESPGKTDVPFKKAQSKIEYSTHVQGIGWQRFVNDGEMAGTSQHSKRLEAIKIQLNKPVYSGDIVYKVHVQTYGWQNKKKNGEIAGTSGESKRLEAIKISLTGELADKFDIYYRTHVQKYGWLDWAKNGEESGSEGYSYRLEAIEIKLIEKGDKVPENTEKPFLKK